MSTAIHHAMSSANRWGGVPADYLAIHEWFDESKTMHADFRHRMLRHHSEGIRLCEQVFGPMLQVSTGRQIPVRWVAEQHVQEDFAGRIPSVVDWMRAVRPERWMSPKIGPVQDQHQSANDDDDELVAFDAGVREGQRLYFAGRRA